MDANYILHVLRNGKDPAEVKQACVDACNLLERYHTTLREALRMLTAVEQSSKLSNEALNKLGYQDFQETAYRFLRETHLEATSGGGNRFK